MKKFLLASAFVMLPLLAVAASSEVVPVSAQEKLMITIYNQNRALIKDVRSVDLTKGLNKIVFEDISNEVMPETVLLTGSGVKVLEQNFNFDLLSYDSLMQKAVGQTVTVEYVNPATGQVSTNSAELLAFNDLRPVLKIGDKIEANYPGRVIFNKVPENLAAKPQLVFDVDSQTAQKENVEIAYLSTGLSWNADYVVDLNEQAGKMNLNALVTLTNNTAVSYKNASLQLVAGDLNITQRPTRMYKNEMVMMARAASMDSDVEAESVAGYYLYTLKRPTDILSHQTKQVSLLSGSDVGVNKTYEYTSSLNFEGGTEFKNAKPAMFLSFKNTAENGLGEALPKGTVRVYQKSASGQQIFVGEDSINHTAKNQEVRLRLGEDFDITIAGQRTQYQKLGSKTAQASFEVKVSNAKPTKVTVRVAQYLPNGWKILSESLKSQKQNSNMIYWNVEVPAESATTVTYKVLVQ